MDESQRAMCAARLADMRQGERTDLASTVQAFVQENAVKFQGNDSALFRDFDPQVYTVWNFSKLTNKTTVIDAMSQPEAATLLNVSRPSVQRAAQVQQDGIPELADAVDAGE